MSLERNDYYGDLQNAQNIQSLQDQCKRCLYYHVNLIMTDGSTLDGIIENVDKDRVSILVGEDMLEGESENQPDQQRQYNRRPRRRFRRFRRQTFPLATLAALALLPYPYIAPPPYPYYPYY